MEKMIELLLSWRMALLSSILSRRRRPTPETIIDRTELFIRCCC